MTEAQKTYQGHLEISEVIITNFVGKEFSLFGFYGEININEDLFSPVCSGSIDIMESGNIIEDLPIIGEETIRISYRDEFSNIVTRSFAVYSVTDKFRLNETNISYKLNFCSEEMLLNKDSVVSRAFTNMAPHEVVKSIIENDLSSKKTFTFEETINSVNYIAPTVTPFSVAASMAARAYSLTNQKGSLYLFYEDVSGFVFKPIETLIKGEPIAYTFGNANLDNANTSRLIMKHAFVSPVNNLKSMLSGSFGVNSKILDLDTKTLRDASYNYNDEEQYIKSDFINGENPGLKLTSSRYKYKKNEGVRKLVVGSDSDRTEALAKRCARLSMISAGPRLILEVPFNAQLTVGMMVSVAFPSAAIDRPGGATDGYDSGKYLITALKHIISSDRGSTSIEVVKDSWAIDFESNIEKLNARLGI